MLTAPVALVTVTLVILAMRIPAVWKIPATASAVVLTLIVQAGLVDVNMAMKETLMPAAKFRVPTSLAIVVKFLIMNAGHIMDQADTRHRCAVKTIISASGMTVISNRWEHLHVYRLDTLRQWRHAKRSCHWCVILIFPMTGPVLKEVMPRFLAEV